MVIEFRKNAYMELESYDTDNNQYILISSNGQNVTINGTIEYRDMQQILQKMVELQNEIIAGVGKL